MNVPWSDDRSVETTSSDKSSHESNETDIVAILVIVEVDGLFDDVRPRNCWTPSSSSSVSDNTNGDTFITKIRIYQSELIPRVVAPPMERPTGSSDVVSNSDPPPTTGQVFTSRQLRDKIQFHFAGRLSIPAVLTKSTTTSTTTTNRRCGEGTEGCYHIYVLNHATNVFVPLPDDDTINVIPLFGTRWRLRVIYKADDRYYSSSSTENAPTPLLAIQGRYFADDIHPDGTITISEHQLQVLPPHPASPVDASVGTGYHIWDGALLLMRYLESMRHIIFFDQNERVLELGSGCGVVGLTAALLGAKSVVLTDLPELLPFLQSNIDANSKTVELARKKTATPFMDCTIRCESCDWTAPVPTTIQTQRYDIILIADCIWIESLVIPLFNTLRKLTDNDTTITHRTAIVDDSRTGTSKIPQTILEHQVITLLDDVQYLSDHMANCSISHLDLHTSKTSLDESPVNSDADIYHQQSSLQLSGHVNVDDVHTTGSNPSATMEQSLSSILVESDTKIPLILIEDQSLESEHQSLMGHCTRVLISYQRRGKSTHETFTRELHALFTVVEIVTIPHFQYPQDIFYLYSCRR